MQISVFLTVLLVWIMGHVLSGWDGSNPLKNPTNLCEYIMYFVVYLIA